jgi:methanogenic corrinoid protein MtbC1
VHPDGRYQEYVDALVAGDRASCSAILDEELTRGLPIKSIYVDFVTPSLYEIGDRWERNELSVADEHLATSITEELLNQVFAAMVPAAPVGRSVIVAAFSPEMHRVGARIVADVFELKGWDSRFVGADTPSGQLRHALAEGTPDLVALSSTNPSITSTFVERLGELRHAHPDLEVLLGGQAMRHIGRALAERDPLLKYIATLDELELYLSDGMGASRRPRLGELGVPHP